MPAFRVRVGMLISTTRRNSIIILFSLAIVAIGAIGGILFYDRWLAYKAVTSASKQVKGPEDNGTPQPSPLAPSNGFKLLNNHKTEIWKYAGQTVQTKPISGMSYGVYVNGAMAFKIEGSAYSSICNAYDYDGTQIIFIHSDVGAGSNTISLLEIRKNGNLFSIPEFYQTCFLPTHVKEHHGKMYFDLESSNEVHVRGYVYNIRSNILHQYSTLLTHRNFVDNDVKYSGQAFIVHGKIERLVVYGTPPARYLVFTHYHYIHGPYIREGGYPSGMLKKVPFGGVAKQFKAGESGTFYVRYQFSMAGPSLATIARHFHG